MKTSRLILAAFLLLASRAPAQDMIDVFRGDEIDDRTFEYKRDYFLDVLAFQFDPLWEKLWDSTDSAYRGNAGSLDSKTIWIHQEAKLRPELDGFASYRFHFLQAEDFDSRFVRFTFEPDFEVHENLRIGVPLQILQEKSGMDLGLALQYQGPGIRYLKLSYIATDPFFNDSTDQNRKFDKNSGTVAFQGNIEPWKPLWIKWTVGRILPLTWKINDLLYTFDFERLYYRSIAQINLGESSDLFFWLSGEQTSKDKIYDPALAFLDNHLGRNAVTARTEFRRRFGSKQLKGGLQYFRLRENDVLINNVTNTNFLRRREYAGYLGFETQLDEGVSVFGKERISLFANFLVSAVNNQDLFLNAPAISSINETYLSKLHFGAKLQFRPGAWVVVSPSLQFYSNKAYGGSNIQIQVDF